MLRYLLIVFFVIGNLPQFLWGQLKPIAIEGQEKYYFNDVFFLDETVGFLSGSDGTTGNSQGLILKTIDGGETWTKSFIEESYSSIFSVYFLNETLGYLGAEAESIYKTTDGGNNFVRLNTANVPFSMDFMDIHFFDESQGILLGAANIYKTYDGGESIQNVRQDGRIWEKIQFVNQETAFALGYKLTTSGFHDPTKDNIFVKTTNKGDTWEVVVDSLDYNLRSFHFLDESNGFACSYDEKIYKSTNAGQTWELASSSPDECSLALFDITFFNEEVGYAVGGSTYCQDKSAVLWETRDGGENWNRILIEDEFYFRKITRISDNTGLIMSWFGEVYLINTDEITTVKALEAKPSIALQLSPNPFQNDFQLQFELQKPSVANIELYNIEGQRQNILSKKRLEAGLQSFEIKPSFSSTSNIYFIEVIIDGNKHTEKVIRYK